MLLHGWWFVCTLLHAANPSCHCEERSNPIGYLACFRLTKFLKLRKSGSHCIVAIIQNRHNYPDFLHTGQMPYIHLV
jgi:hypothetical protein